MIRISRTLTALMHDEEGQGLVEYALIVVFISLVAVGALTAIGTNVNDVLQRMAAEMSNALGS